MRAVTFHACMYGNNWLLCLMPCRVCDVKKISPGGFSDVAYFSV